MNAFDTTILHLVNQFAGRSWSFDVAMSVMAESLVVKAVVIAAVVGVWCSGSRGRDVVLRTVPGIFAALLISRALSMFVVPFRVRPMANAALGFVVPAEAPRFLERLSSFPSDHAVLFAALVVPVFLVRRAWGVALAAYVAVAIYAPRLYAGLHYPTDILAGAVIGAAVALGAYHLVPGSTVATAVSWEARRPMLFRMAAFLLALETADLFESTRKLGRFAMEAWRDLRHLPPQTGGLMETLHHSEAVVATLGVVAAAVLVVLVIVSLLRHQAWRHVPATPLLSRHGRRPRRKPS